MQTSKGLIALLISALAVVTTIAMEARQDSTEKTPQAAREKPSGTRFASALVKLTVDPDIIVLNPDTVESLMYSPIVAQDATAILGLKATADIHDFLLVEWLSQDVDGIDDLSARPSSPTEPQDQDEYHREMTRQMEEIYGGQYMKEFGWVPPSDDKKKEEVREGRTGRPSRTEGAASRGMRVRSDPGMYDGMSEGLYGGIGRGMSGRRRSGLYGEAAGREADRHTEQTALVNLTVSLPQDVTPAAVEFLTLVVENLRTSLMDAYEKRTKELANRSTFAESRLVDAEVRLERAMGGDSPGQMRVNAQLDMIVDLSGLTPEMPVSEAVALLRNAVEPPLQLVVLWRDLVDNAQIEPASPIEIDGLPDVRMRTALEVLLEALGAGHTELSYRIRGNVITVGTADTLAMSARPAPVTPAAIDVEALAAQRTELARKVQNLELELAGQEARRTAILEQIEITRRQTDEKVAGDQVLGELERVLALAVQALSQEEGKFAPQNPALQSEAMRELREQVARAKIEVARRREEIVRSAGGQRLEEFNTELSRIAIDRAEKQAQLDILRRQFQAVQQQLAAASTFDPEAARIRMAREAFDIAARQVAEWQTRLATLQPPMVTLIGAD